MSLIQKKLYKNTSEDSRSLTISFIKALTKKGKYYTAKKILIKIAYYLKINKKLNIYDLIYKAILNIRPLITLKNQNNSKYNKKNIIIPIKLIKSYNIAIRWLIKGAKLRKENTMSLCLYNELIDAYNKKGYALKKKYEWHKNILSLQIKSYSFKK